MRTIIIGGLVAVLAIQAPASAQDVRIATVPVRVGSIDPAALRAKVVNAIDTVCGTYAAAPYPEWTDIGRCRRQARADSERQIAKLIERDSALRLAATR